MRKAQFFGNLAAKNCDTRLYSKSAVSITMPTDITLPQGLTSTLYPSHVIEGD